MSLEETSEVLKTSEVSSGRGRMSHENCLVLLAAGNGSRGRLRGVPVAQGERQGAGGDSKRAGAGDGGSGERGQCLRKGRGVAEGIGPRRPTGERAGDEGVAVGEGSSEPGA